MPAKLPLIDDGAALNAVAVGRRIRAHRKQLGVSATSAAQAAGMSRVTWYRLEKGEPSVTMGAYLSALSVLGLELAVLDPSKAETGHDEAGNEGWIPARVVLADYPQLRRLAWQLQGVDELSPREALGIYERNWRHLDQDSLKPHEHALIAALRLAFRDDEGRDV